MRLSVVVLSLVLIFSAFSGASYAKELAEDSPSPTPSPTIAYTLPYPGILPGNPIYPVKVLRDRLVEFFISDTLKKAEFYLLQGDKHISAGQLLVDKDHKNYPLAESTISKGENYMQLALDQIPDIKATQRDERELLNRMVTAFKKHQEVIRDLEKTAPLEIKDKLAASRERAIDMQKTAESLIPKQK
jgi:hypothetical protein